MPAFAIHGHGGWTGRTRSKPAAKMLATFTVFRGLPKVDIVLKPALHLPSPIKRRRNRYRPRIRRGRRLCTAPARNLCHHPAIQWYLHCKWFAKLYSFWVERPGFVV